MISGIYPLKRAWRAAPAVRKDVQTSIKKAANVTAATVVRYGRVINKWSKEHPTATRFALAAADTYLTGGVARFGRYGALRRTLATSRRWKPYRGYSRAPYRYRAPYRRRNYGTRRPYKRPYRSYASRRTRYGYKRYKAKPRYRFKKKPYRFNKRRKYNKYYY